MTDLHIPRIIIKNRGSDIDITQDIKEELLELAKKDGVSIEEVQKRIDCATDLLKAATH